MRYIYFVRYHAVFVQSSLVINECLLPCPHLAIPVHAVEIPPSVSKPYVYNSQERSHTKGLVCIYSP